MKLPWPRKKNDTTEETHITSETSDDNQVWDSPPTYTLTTKERAVTTHGAWTCIFCQENTQYKSYLRKIGVKRYGRAIMPRHESANDLLNHLKLSHVEQVSHVKLDFPKHARQSYEEKDKELVLSCFVNLLATADWGWKLQETVNEAVWFPRKLETNPLEGIYKGGTPNHEATYDLTNKDIFIRAQNLAAEQLGRTYAGIDTIIRYRKDRVQPYAIFAEGNKLNQFGMQQIQKAREALVGTPSDVPEVPAAVPPTPEVTKTMSDVQTITNEPGLSSEDENYHHINGDMVLAQLKTFLPDNDHTTQLYTHMVAIVGEAKRVTIDKEEALEAQQNLRLAQTEISKEKNKTQEAVDAHNKSINEFNEWMDKIATAVGYSSAQSLMDDVNQGLMPKANTSAKAQQGIANVGRKAKADILNTTKGIRVD